MRNLGTIFRKEFAAYFISPIAYIFIMVFQVVRPAENATAVSRPYGTKNSGLCFYGTKFKFTIIWECTQLRILLNKLAIAFFFAKFTTVVLFCRQNYLYKGGYGYLYYRGIYRPGKKRIAFRWTAYRYLPFRIERYRDSNY